MRTLYNNNNNDYTSFHIYEKARLAPAIETYSDTIDVCMKRRGFTILSLLAISFVWIVMANIMSEQTLMFLSFPSIIILITMLFKSKSLDRTDQKKIKLVAKIGIFKALFGVFLTAYIVSNYFSVLSGISGGSGISVIFACLLEAMYLVLGGYIYVQTDKIVKILELEFYDKTISNYFEIAI